MLLAIALSLVAFAPPAPARKPNVLLILADDLGSGDLGCYGQKKITTPQIDHLAAQGLRHTIAYCGAPVCAPSRCALLTGRDMGHAAIRDNRGSGKGNDAEWPMRAGEFTLAESLKGAGYATACIGKWGLGPMDSEGSPLTQGFSRFYGFIGQVPAHDHYPKSLFDDEKTIELDGKTYAADLFLKQGIEFLTTHAKEPFFLFYATTVPHLALQVPDDSLAEYNGKFPETPYEKGQGYQPQKTPHAAYAAMVSRFDRDVGTLLSKLDELGLAQDTIVILASDNGGTFDAAGSDTRFFKSNGDLRGVKGQLYDGGIRCPLIVRWPGHVKAGSTADSPVALFDLFATLAPLCGAAPPVKSQGVDLGSLWLEGKSLAPRSLYFEHSSGGGWRAVRDGDWKLVVRGEKKKKDGAVTRELFDLRKDPNETTDLAVKEPKVLARLAAHLGDRTPSSIADWEFP